jgi:hypothetical protein
MDSGVLSLAIGLKTCPKAELASKQQTSSLVIRVIIAHNFRTGNDKWLCCAVYRTATANGQPCPMKLASGSGCVVGYPEVTRAPSWGIVAVVPAKRTPHLFVNIERKGCTLQQLRGELSR